MAYSVSRTQNKMSFFWVNCVELEAKTVSSTDTTGSSLSWDLWRSVTVGHKKQKGTKKADARRGVAT